jgi:hypothetical protein
MERRRLACDSMASSHPGSRSLAGLSNLDQWIVGALVLFLLVFAFELRLVLPCGGWEQIARCEAAIKTDSAWSLYFEIDPFWSAMPSWYAAVMNLQDLVYNPFWVLSLAFYLLHRQDAAWFRTATISVSSMIITTSVVVYTAQAAHPDITGRKLLMLFLVNSPWVLFPALFIFRMHRAGERSGDAGRAV